jgi:hypothetical protein
LFVSSLWLPLAWFSFGGTCCKQLLPLLYHIFSWYCHVRYYFEVFKDVHSGFPVCCLSWGQVLIITLMGLPNMADWSVTGNSCSSTIWHQYANPSVV